MAELVSVLLRRSIDHLENEVPASYRLILDKLGPLMVEIKVDGELFVLHGGHRLVVSDATIAAGITITTSRSAILDVIDARTGLEQAVEAAAVQVKGTVDDVLRVHDVLRAYVHATVRAPSQSKLLLALRAGAG